MRKYKIIFYFPTKNGEQETYEDGFAKYNSEIITAYNGGEAIDKLRKMFKEEPKIEEVREVQ